MGVVAGVGVETVEETLDEGVLVGSHERDVHLAFPTDRPIRLAVARRRRAEAPEPVGGVETGVIGDQCGQAQRRPILGAGQLVGRRRVAEIGAPDRAVQHRAAAEDRRWSVRGAHDVAEVVMGVTRRVYDVDPERPHGEVIAVGDRDVVEAQGLGGGVDVPRAGEAGERQPSADVVVVDVRLRDVADAHASTFDDCQDAIDVAVGVDDQCRVAVVDDVGQVSEGRGLDREHVHDDLLLAPRTSRSMTSEYPVDAALSTDAARSRCRRGPRRRPSPHLPAHRTGRGPGDSPGTPQRRRRDRRSRRRRRGDPCCDARPRR